MVIIITRVGQCEKMATSDEGRRYAGKVTIVTGGAQGIGRGCVEVFSKFLIVS